MLIAASLSACAPKRTAVPAEPTIIKQRIAESDSPLTLVHVWATWCQPCREEFPELIKVQRRFGSKGLALILVSADDPAYPDTVEAFLNEQKSPVDSLISTELNQRFVETLSSTWSGALPASFFFDVNGVLLAEWEGKQSYEHYSATIGTLLKQTQGDTP